MAYDKTEVPAARSQEQIRKMLRSAGADRIMCGEIFTGERKAAGVEFNHRSLLVRVVCPFIEARGEINDQEIRRVWRVLHWCIKARMEAVENGLETFEQAFLPHIVDPGTRMTIWQMIQPAIERGAMAIDSGEGFGPEARAIGAGVDA